MCVCEPEVIPVINHEPKPEASKDQEGTIGLFTYMTVR